MSRSRKKDVEESGPGAKTAGQCRERLCMCCAWPFASAGAHNRLCSPCARQSLTSFDRLATFVARR